jgi:preprotein translocase subunit SecE
MKKKDVEFAEKIVKELEELNLPKKQPIMYQVIGITIFWLIYLLIVLGLAWGIVSLIKLIF